MTEAHKAALAAGRAQGIAVKNYLEALENTKPKRGRKRTPDTIKMQIEGIDAIIDSVPVVTRLSLIQKRMDLVAEHDALAGPGVDIDTLGAEFVKVAAAYSKAKGISYTAWREIGVDPAVLKKAGISRAG
jgi:hypothetical protein